MGCCIAGIGTDTSPGSLANLILRPSANLTTKKTLDQALATSFNQHVIGGYRFLARRWKPGCRVYLFGFSRGAYTARFLNEMLDYVGLISADNEELIPFVWEAFLNWKFAPQSNTLRQDAYDQLRLSRETMCRPIDRVHFLGLFDTVSSVAQFGSGQEPTSCQPRPSITRHAVSIDERRIKFQPVLFGDESGTKRRKPIRCDQSEEMYAAESDSDDDTPTDLEEVYFAGDHSDVGGGWRPDAEETHPRSHIPLMWMVNEAMLAGLTFDNDKVHSFYISPPSSSSASTLSTSSKHTMPSIAPDELRSLSQAELSQIHDSLDFDSGKGLTTFFWRLLELLPFERRLVQPDGSVIMSRWHRSGQRRPLPERALIHGSVVRKLRQDPDYRPFNLGLGLKPDMREYKEEDRDIGKWEQVRSDGVREYWVRV